jgi:hypothetical protein
MAGDDSRLPWHAQRRPSARPDRDSQDAWEIVVFAAPAAADRCGAGDGGSAFVKRLIPTSPSTPPAARASPAQTTEAIEHLRRAIEMWDGCREMAKHDSDLDAIRDEPAFQALVG